VRSSDPRRQFLLEIYAAASLPGADAISIVLRRAQRFELGASSLGHAGAQSAERLAIRMAHKLEIGGEGLTVWSGSLLPCGAEGPAQYLALAAARLLAGRDQVLLLAAALMAPDGASSDAGALIDGETCARIAVAGLDLETEFRCANCNGALAAAGDLLAVKAGMTLGSEAPRYLVIGLKASVATSAGIRAAQGEPGRLVL